MRLIATAFALVLATPVFAGKTSSDYTKLHLDSCPVVERNEEYGSVTWGCTGYRGMPIYVAEGDLRYFVSFGPNGHDTRAGGQTLPPFNTINDTIEWRLESGQPFAAIHRWFTDVDGYEGQVLVVTSSRAAMPAMSPMWMPRQTAMPTSLPARQPIVLHGRSTAARKSPSSSARRAAAWGTDWNRCLSKFAKRRSPLRQAAGPPCRHRALAFPWLLPPMRPAGHRPPRHP